MIAREGRARKGHRKLGWPAVLVSLGALALPSSAGAVTETFEHTGAAQEFAVPPGVTQLTIDAHGGAGGSGNGGAVGGLGGRSTAQIAVSPGEVLEVNVGGAGADGAPGAVAQGGFNGGGSATCGGGAVGSGGGGASDVRRDANGDGARSLDERLVVAGGGGGSQSSATAGGGSGGGATGGDGSVDSGDSTPGRGGTQSAGGAGGTAFGGAFPAQPGALGSGGDANGCSAGGGGGLYGGGGGSFSGGGGGGSGFTPDGTGMTNGVRAGHGRIVLTYFGVQPGLTTKASGATTVGGEVFDTATLTGGASPSGTITFRLYGPGDGDCSRAPVFTHSMPVSGNGAYRSESFTPSEPGVYRWIAAYSGDADNRAAAGLCNDPDEAVEVAAAPAPGPVPAIEVVEVDRDREDGTATLGVSASVGGNLTIDRTKKVLGFGPLQLGDAGIGRLEVVPRAKAAARLERLGRLTVNPRIRLIPAGGEPVTLRHRFQLRHD